jgi:hypothetical protein
MRDSPSPGSPAPLTVTAQNALHGQKDEAVVLRVARESLRANPPSLRFIPRAARRFGPRLPAAASQPSRPWLT